MAIYIYQATYTTESLRAQIDNPQDRIEAITPTIEALGGQVLVNGHPFGESDLLTVFEVPDDTAAASFALAVGAGGAVRNAKTTRLLSGGEWVESLRKAQGAHYRPAL